MSVIELQMKLNTSRGRLAAAKAEERELANIVAVSRFLQDLTRLTDSFRRSGTASKRDRTFGGWNEPDMRFMPNVSLSLPWRKETLTERYFSITSSDDFLSE